MTKLTKEEVLKIYDRVFHYHFQQPHQINNILTVAAEIQDAYQAKNIQINALKSALREARKALNLAYEGKCDLETVPNAIATINEVLGE